jgi:uncharacterized protein (UPF0335 family)
MGVEASMDSIMKEEQSHGIDGSVVKEIIGED